QRPRRGRRAVLSKRRRGATVAVLEGLVKASDRLKPDGEGDLGQGCGRLLNHLLGEMEPLRDHDFNRRGAKTAAEQAAQVAVRDGERFGQRLNAQFLMRARLNDPQGLRYETLRLLRALHARRQIGVAPQAGAVSGALRLGGASENENVLGLGLSRANGAAINPGGFNAEIETAVIARVPARDDGFKIRVWFHVHRLILKLSPNGSQRLSDIFLLVCTPRSRYRGKKDSQGPTEHHVSSLDQVNRA